MQRNRALLILVLPLLIVIVGCNIGAKVAVDATESVSNNDPGNAPLSTAAHPNDPDSSMLPASTECSDPGDCEPPVESVVYQPISFENGQYLHRVFHFDGGWGRLALSPGGRFFVAWNTTNIWLYDSREMNVAPRLIFSSDFIIQVNWSPSADLLAVLHSTPMGGSKLLFMDAHSGEISVEITNHPEFPRMAAFSPDGNWLAVPTGNEMILYDVASGTPISRFPIENTAYGDIKVDHANHLIALCSSNTQLISVYDIGGGLIGQKNVPSCGFKWANSEIILVESQPSPEKMIFRIWDPVSNTITNQMEEMNSKEEVIVLLNAQDASPNILFISDANKVYIFDINTGQYQELQIEEDPSLGMPVSHVSLMFLPEQEGFVAITGSYIVFYDVAKQSYASFRSPYLDSVESVSFFVSPSLLVSQSSDSINLWDIRKREITHSFSLNDLNCIDSNCYSGTFHTPSTTLSPDGEKILVATHSQGSEELIILNARDLTVIQRLEHPLRGVAINTQGWINNEKVMVMNDYSAVVVDIISGDQVGRLEWGISDNDCCGVGESYFSTVRLSPDQSIMAATVWKYLIVFDTGSMAILNKWMIDTEQPITDVAWFPDSTQLAVSHQDGRITFWNVNGEKIRPDIVTQETVYGLAFSPDGGLLAYQSGMNLYLVSTATQDEKAGILSQFNPETSNYALYDYSISWSPDGSLIVICAQDGGMVVFGSE